MSTVDEILASGRQCLIDGCDRPVAARGWCSTHYSRWKRNGDVNAVRSNRGKPAAERFWEKVDMNGPTLDIELGQCWVWEGADDSYGCGCFYVDGRKAKAHRFSYELAHGAIPSNALIDHRCHNPSCVRPGHLRQSDRSLNGINRGGTSAASTTGFRGVYLRESGRYQARFKDRRGRKITVGMFDDPNEASLAVREARRKEWGDHAGRDR